MKQQKQMFGGGLRFRNKDNSEKENKKIVTILGILVLIILVIGLTYAAFTYSQAGSKNNTITTGVISMSYDTEETNGIQLTNALPMTDAVGMAQTADNAVFDFTVSITTTGTPVTFEVTAEKTSGDLEYEDVKLYLTRSTTSSGTYTAVAEPSVYTAIGKTDELGATSSEMRLDSGVVSSITTYYYQLRMWVASTYEIGETAKSFTVKVNAYGKNGNITLTSASSSATGTITNLVSENSSTMMTDDAGNVRYMGANPNNYVTFNGESAGWRIVGVFGDNIKLVRSESIGNWSWDSSAVTVNSGQGVNSWAQADLMKLLNDGYSSESVGGSLYWNRGNGNCYNNSSNAKTTCDFSSTGLTSDAQNMIASTTWYLGGAAWTYDATTGGSDKTASQWYSLERGSYVYNCSTDDGACPRPTTWTGKVGLLYPSDYGYASSSCNSSRVLVGDSRPDYSDSACTGSNWLYLGSAEWLLSPAADSIANPSRVWYVFSSGNAQYGLAYYKFAVRPAVYSLSRLKRDNHRGNWDFWRSIHAWKLGNFS